MTVPVDDAPPLTLDGDTVTLTSGGIVSAGGFTVNARLAALAPYADVSETDVVLAIDFAVTNANEAVVDPLKTVTLAGSEVKSSG